eukprot:COSAG06_NODE_32_length_31260_cov_54.706973_8_plen_214_part_00
MFLVHDLLSKDECNAIHSKGGSRFVNVGGFEAGKAGGYKIDQRTSVSAALNPHEIPTVRKRMSELFNVSASQFDNTNITKYPRDAEYHTHLDAIPDTSRKASAAGKNEGLQRIITSFVYLNDVNEGGPTTFADLGVPVEDACWPLRPESDRKVLKVQPRQGMCVVFFPGFLPTASETEGASDDRGRSPLRRDHRLYHAGKKPTAKSSHCCSIY